MKRRAFSVGSGAAPLITQRSDEVSYFAQRPRAAASRCARSIVGTISVQVMRSRSMIASARLGLEVVHQHDGRAERHHDRRRTPAPPSDRAGTATRWRSSWCMPTCRIMSATDSKPVCFEVAVRALGLAGGARGVDDDAAAVAVRAPTAAARRDGRARVVPAIPVGGQGAAVAGDHHPRRHRRGGQPLGLGEAVDVSGADHGRARLGVVEDVRDLRRLRAIADLHRGGADAGERLLRDHVLGVVAEQTRDRRAGARRARPARARAG